MAKQANGFLGGFSGRLGPAVGYRWKGTWCLRAQPRKVRNPRSEAQQQHRSLFKAEVQLGGRMRWAVNVGMKRVADELGMTAPNLFVHANHQFFSLSDGQLEVDYASLSVSAGPVAPVALTEATVDADNVLHVRFEKNPLHRASSGVDNIFVWVYDAEAERGYLCNPVYRRAERMEALLPESLGGDGLHVYAFAQDAQGRCSATAYMATTREADEATSGVVDEAIDAGENAALTAQQLAHHATHEGALAPEHGEAIDGEEQRAVG